MGGALDHHGGEHVHNWSAMIGEGTQSIRLRISAVRTFISSEQPAIRQTIKSIESQRHGADLLQEPEHIFSTVMGSDFAIDDRLDVDA